MILWQTYLEWFTKQYDLIKGDLLEPSHIEIGPFLEPTDQRYQDAAPFVMDWAVIYTDEKYFRVKETYDRAPKPAAGAGVRAAFSFHYGKAHKRRDADGFPLIRDPKTPSADLRIDLDSRSGPHIHLNSPDHIPQNRVEGYSISDADVFRFLRAVIDHRRGNTPLHDLLGIKVI